MKDEMCSTYLTWVGYIIVSGCNGGYQMGEVILRWIWETWGVKVQTGIRWPNMVTTLAAIT
jgi:hypothetical protein